MFLRQFARRNVLAASVAGIALCAASPAYAQSAPAAADEADDPSGEEAIVVTGSRIERAGFDQPTPTTVVGGAEIQQSAQVNLQQALNELPQMRNSVSPNQSIGNTSAGTAPVELRGLESARTLTLVNGRRFVGDNNLNFVPTNLVERVELVTGGASAAWGSGAVAGVVNIILNEDLEGLSVGAQSSISSRGDGWRYAIDGSFGTHFAGGAGHFMIGAEYLKDEGIGIEGRRSRPWFGAGVVDIGGGQFEIQPDVNDLAPISFGGTVLSGAFAGQVFNPDGTLRPAQPSDFFSIYDTLIVASPLERLGSYARLSYDIGEATFWVDAAYGRSDVNQPFFPDPASPVLVFSVAANNPFLSSQIQQQLAAAGEPSFLVGRFSRDTFLFQFDAVRETKEIAFGVDGSFGDGWRYDAHFSHGEVDSRQRFANSSIPANFLNAINAVEVGGQIVCSVNADADPANDDPACVPFNPFGEDAASPEAIEYVRGTQMQDEVTKLDSAAVRLQGDPFSLWAGPVSIAVGAEARWEEQSQEIGELDAAGVFGTPLFNDPLEGGFNVKEAFFETLVPLLDSEEVDLDLNGAARYSDYSLSGGIWSWKIGGTARLFRDVLLRATRSRDIRAPSIGNLFSVSSINIAPVVDNDSEGRDSNPGYDPNPNATIFSGGNPDLVPEVAKTWTAGATFSPSFLRGFNLSVDYYDISIGNAIATPNTADITAACAAGDQDACDRVIRDGTGTITTVFAFAQNIARFQTSGFDIEASYQMPMSRIADVPGTLRLRALATYVDKLVFETGANVRDTAGDVGDPVANGLPKWRANFSAAYQTDSITVDARIRYVGGGQFNDELNIVNGDIGARTYVDLGAEFRVMDRFTFFGRVRNVFDVNPPLITTTYNAHYDVVGRFFTVGARVNF
ncbi:TonB-dependent receptor domain-containing protein [Sphingosinicella sp. CPCC 101087]|uniref:TonB-dependent receptor domain-containing protein n=1 Tax=Sphingosinicella sp. CPCC 101087 TaxID=2497754 RepID=UPI00101B878B|nr:TonB-dependent receptor [Sphingosinicella sp. CPCC 101087]